VTPEAYIQVEKWMNYRKDVGETITKNRWVIRNIWDTKKSYSKGMITAPKKLKSTGVKRIIEDALWTQSLRKKLEISKQPRLP